MRLLPPVRIGTVEVRGDSMLPTLRPGDRLVVRLGASVRAGDIVVARQPGKEVGADLRTSDGVGEDGPLIVKRVFRRESAGWWLESDNQRAPGRRDSWDFGAVPESHITARVVGRYWPLSRLSISASALSRRRAR
ncbi:MAG TPA: S24/S26 family peptidase [Streptosporangiaceae bacterium]|jgi:phage repressor protein C with HTH and peptisase S24 domain